MYALLGTAGAILTFYPSKIVVDQVGSTITFLWSLGIAISAFCAFLGSVGDRWIGEYIFLPLLWTSLMFYGLSAMFGAKGPFSTLFAFGLLIMGFSCGLIARWQDVRDIKASAEFIHGDE